MPPHDGHIAGNVVAFSDTESTRWIERTSAHKGCGLSEPGTGRQTEEARASLGSCLKQMPTLLKQADSHTVWVPLNHGHASMNALMWDERLQAIQDIARKDRKTAGLYETADGVLLVICRSDGGRSH